VATPGGMHIPKWDRPLRIPPEVPLLHADPPYALAGQRGRWRLAFRLLRDVSQGEALRLQLFGSRNNRGAVSAAQVASPAEEGYVAAHTEDGQVLGMRPGEAPGTFVIHVPEGGFRAGQIVHVTVGEGKGIRIVPCRTLNKFFLLYCPGGEGAPPPTAPGGGHQIVGACTMHVLGGRIHHLRAYVPPQTIPGEPFAMIVRGEDEFSNLSCEPPGELSVSAEDREIAARAERVADSTCVRLLIQLPAEGIYRLKVKDRAAGLEAVANPTLCRTGKSRPSVYWGMIHGHTEMSDGMGTLEYYFRQMRDEAGLDFAAPGDHDHLWETSDALWDLACKTVARWNEPGRFVTLLGYEWAKWRRNGDGDRNVYYLQDHRPMYRSDEGCRPTPPDLFDALASETAVIIPHHTGHAGNFCDFKDHDPLRERLIEIYQCRGSYENAAEDGNPVPERYDDPPVAAGFVQRALAMGWRVGFTAGGDDHTGHAGTDYPIRLVAGIPYKAGLMSVAADTLTREDVWDALWNRRVVATTGARMLLDFRVGGHPMGSELDLLSQPGLGLRRRVHVEFHGTAPVERIDVIRNNEIARSERPGGMDCEMDWDDTDPIDAVLLAPAKFCDHRFCFYYVRVVQSDGEVAWASPIWIDENV